MQYKELEDAFDKTSITSFILAATEQKDFDSHTHRSTLKSNMSAFTTINEPAGEPSFFMQPEPFVYMQEL